MKTKVYILVALMLLCSILLTSCGFIDTIKGIFNKDNQTDEGEGGEGENNGEGEGEEEGDDSLIEYPDGTETVNITEEKYSFICVGEDEALRASFDNLIYRIGLAVGKAPTVASAEADAKVVFSVEDYTSYGTNFVIGRCEIAFRDGKLHISAGDVESLNFAKDRLLSFAGEDGIVLPAAMNEAYMFNIYNYRVGKTTVYTEADMKNITLLSEVTVGGSPLIGFSPIINSYAIEHEGGEYPVIGATALNSLARVDIEQASADNLGTCKITVSSNGYERIYRLSFYKNTVSSVAAEIVNKGGAKGTICFVIDDGTESTAKFMVDNILGKPGYENITASFALITKKIATMQTEYNENGELVYKIDENGKYVYDEIAGKFDFWRNVLATGKAYVISHTHTHTYEGDNDSGGIFRYKKNDGTYANTPFFPLGNVTMELVASNQIIKDLAGVDDSIGLILPGVGAAHSGYFNNLYLNCGEYIISRGTAGSTSVIKDYETIVYHPEELLTMASIKSVKSYMIEHFLSSPDGSTTSSSTNAECLAAGIQNWKDFMDTAIATGGWASFCIHEIRPDTYKGGDHHIYESQAKELFAYANNYGSDAWIASYNDAAKYFIEWGRSTVKTAVYDNRVIAVELESDVADPRLDMALTVKVEIPDSWEGVTLDGAELEILSDDTGRFVYIDVLPGAMAELVATGYNIAEDNMSGVIAAD